MIMAYVKMAFAAAMMLVQPIQHGYDRGQVGDGRCCGFVPRCVVKAGATCIRAEFTKRGSSTRDGDPRRKIEARGTRHYRKTGRIKFQSNAADKAREFAAGGQRCCRFRYEASKDRGFAFHG